MPGSCFQACSALLDVSLPDSVEQLGPSAFFGCSALPSLEVPAGVGEVDMDSQPVFGACRALAAFTVSPGNTQLAASDGVLYSADGSQLLAYPPARPGGSFEVPPGVAEIGKSAFAQAALLRDVLVAGDVKAVGSNAFHGSSVERVVIGDSVQELGNWSFCACQELEEVRIGSDIRKINTHAFKNCHALERVVFEGYRCPSAAANILEGSESATVYYYPHARVAWANTPVFGYAPTEMLPPASISAARVELAFADGSTGGEGTPGVYRVGDALPAVRVELDGVELVEGRDYELSFEGADAPGVARAVAAGLLDYCDEASCEFEVVEQGGSGEPGGGAGEAAPSGGAATPAKAADRAAAEAAAAEARAAKVMAVTVNVASVDARAVARAIARAGGKAGYVKTVTLGKKVKKVAKGAFKSCKKVTKLVVKTKKLKKKTVKGSLAGSKVKTVKVKVGGKKANKAYAKKYKKIFTKKVAGRKAKVK